MLGERLTSDPKTLVSSCSAGLGGLTDLKRELQMRPDTVLDVDDKTGASALHHALAYEHLDIVKTLLAAGADPFIEDYSGVPAIFQGLHHLVQGKFSTQQEN